MANVYFTPENGTEPTEPDATDSETVTISEQPPVYLTYMLNLPPGTTAQGTAPTDPNAYLEGDKVVVQDPKNLYVEGYAFLGWAKTINATDPDYSVDGTTVMPNEHTMSGDDVLYAVWGLVPVIDAVEKTAQGGSVRYTAGNALEYTITFDLPADLSTYGGLRIEDVFPNSLIYNGLATAKIGNINVTPIINATTGKVSFGFTAAQLSGHEAKTVELVIRFIISDTATETIVNEVNVYVTPKNGIEPENPMITDSEPVLSEYRVTYNGNGNTSGTAPVDTAGNAPAGSNNYASGSTVNVLGQGNLSRENAVFIGWSRSPSATTPEFAVSGSAVTPASFVITADTVLYAVWNVELRFEGPGEAPVLVNDLRVEKELAFGQPSIVDPGSVVNYVIRVTNTGNTTLTNVVVTEVIDGVTYTVGTIASLAPGQSVEFEFDYTVPADAEPGSIIRSTTYVEQESIGTKSAYADVRVRLLSVDDPEHIWYIRGYEDNTIRPDGNITRAEIAMVFYRLMKSEFRDITPTARFSDVNGDEWYGLAINLLAYYGIFSSYEDGSFRPNQPITRRELATVVSRFDQLVETDVNPFTDVFEDDWAYTYILSAAQKGWFVGDGNGQFRPNDNMKRSEFVTVVNRVFNRRLLLEDVPANVHKFDDLDASHWAYAEFMESVYTHTFIRKADGINEIWTEMIETGLSAAYNQ